MKAGKVVGVKVTDIGAVKMARGSTIVVTVSVRECRNVVSGSRESTKGCVDHTLLMSRAALAAVWESSVFCEDRARLEGAE